MKRRVAVVLGWIIAVCAQSAPAAAPPAAQTFPQVTKATVSAILDELQKDADYKKADKAIDDLFDQAIAFALPRDTEIIREVAFARRLVNFLAAGKKDESAELLPYLRANENLARSLVFLLASYDKRAEICTLLNRLRKERGEQLDKYAALAAAVALVHWQPLQRRLNENTVKSPDPIAIFDYYVKNESRMYFGIKQVPTELLVYVVDTTASIEEMQWALARYAGDAKVGARFFDIKYDYNHLRRGTEKEVSRRGLTLPNILQYGGVCIDQAHFAVSVGKAIGVPTAIATGKSSVVGHAWVGFLQAAGRSGWWNFDIGRYEEYRGLKGSVFDPQYHSSTNDSYVSLLAELIGTRAVDRQTGRALYDAGWRLYGLVKASKSLEPQPLETGITAAAAKPRQATMPAVIELLELAIKQSPGDRQVWFGVMAMAKEDKLTLEQKKKWAELLTRMYGQKYPDFMLSVLKPMVETVDDVKEQNLFWNNAFALFAKRPDLAATVKMAQAEMWEKKGEIDKAGLCYMEVIERYANAGPFVLDALEKAEKALRNSNRANKVPLLYEQTWTRLNKPKEMAGPFMEQSNWFRVGMALIKKLDEVGDAAKARIVRDAIGFTDKRAG